MGVFTPNTWICPANGGTLQLHYENESVEVKRWNLTVQPFGAFTAKQTAGSVNYVDVLITVPANTDPIVKDLSLVINGVNNNGDTIDTAIFNFTLDAKEVTIDGGIHSIYNPITYTTTRDDDSLSYDLKIDNTVVYSGQAYKAPDGDNINFRINDIVDNYLDNKIEIKDSTSLNLIENYVIKPTLAVSKEYTNYTIINNWAYQEIPGTENFTKSAFISDPISTDVDPRQYFLSSIITNKTDKNPVIYKFDNTQYSPIARGEINGYYFMKRVGDINKITATIGDNTMTYNVVNCYNYVLYYKNAFGGWDSLLLKANVKQSDELSYETYKKYPNSFTDFSRVTYMTTITPTWTLYTGILTDKQAEKMYHLITSNEVYLHNLIKDEITPVNIDNNVFEHKSYKNNGNKMFQYEINCTASQDKYRK